jgi:hypothetical protein
VSSSTCPSRNGPGACSSSPAACPPSSAGGDMRP